MKKIVFLCISLLVWMSVQADPNSTLTALNYYKNYTFSNTEEIAGMSSKDLYHNCLLWINKIHKNPKSAIQTADMD